MLRRSNVRKVVVPVVLATVNFSRLHCHQTHQQVSAINETRWEQLGTTEKGSKADKGRHWGEGSAIVSVGLARSVGQGARAATEPAANWEQGERIDQ